MAINKVLEYKCPCCDAGLVFGQDIQKLRCESCENTFDLDAVEAYNQGADSEEEFTWDETGGTQWDDDEQASMQTFLCPACGGEIISDAHTAATFCPYCENPAILPGRLSGSLKPDAVIPFKKSKTDAQDAFVALCKKKLLLPKDFAATHRIEKITGLYVPFWLYSCGSQQNGKYRATRVRSWSDAHYYYTKTDYFLLTRSARADFCNIPLDGSSKLDDAIMESIEPYEYADLMDFETAYLSGYLADKYDVASKDGEPRIRERVGTTMESMIRESCMGYTTVIPTHVQLNIHHSKAQYALLPVWMLTTQYKGKTYTFAMNGQTGKMTGTFPICPKRSAAWFFGVCAAVTAIVSLIQWFAL